METGQKIVGLFGAERGEINYILLCGRKLLLVEKKVEIVVWHQQLETIVPIDK